FQLCDISCGGAKLASQYPLYRGEVVHIQMASARQRLWIDGQIIWCRRQPNGAFHAGVQFSQRVGNESVQR
ncbi:MAG: PilZ domain-containing protein, partial [Phycisphaerae bacterium]